MTNNVLSCVSNALYKEFGYENHMEEIGAVALTNENS